MQRNEHIIRVWTEWIVEGGEQRTELVVVTDLETRPDAAGFDAEAFNDMIRAAIAMFNAGGHERVRVVPVPEQ